MGTESANFDEGTAGQQIPDAPDSIFYYGSSAGGGYDDFVARSGSLSFGAFGRASTVTPETFAVAPTGPILHANQYGNVTVGDPATLFTDGSDATYVQARGDLGAFSGQMVLSPMSRVAGPTVAPPGRTLDQARVRVRFSLDNPTGTPLAAYFTLYGDGGAGMGPMEPWPDAPDDPTQNTMNNYLGEVFLTGVPQDGTITERDNITVPASVLSLDHFWLCMVPSTAGVVLTIYEWEWYWPGVSGSLPSNASTNADLMWQAPEEFVPAGDNPTTLQGWYEAHFDTYYPTYDDFYADLSQVVVGEAEQLAWLEDNYGNGTWERAVMTRFEGWLYVHQEPGGWEDTNYYIWSHLTDSHAFQLYFRDLRYYPPPTGTWVDDESAAQAPPAIEIVVSRRDANGWPWDYTGVMFPLDQWVKVTMDFSEWETGKVTITVGNWSRTYTDVNFQGSAPYYQGLEAYYFGRSTVGFAWDDVVFTHSFGVDPVTTMWQIGSVGMG